MSCVTLSLIPRSHRCSLTGIFHVAEQLSNGCLGTRVTNREEGLLAPYGREAYTLQLSHRVRIKLQ